LIKHGDVFEFDDGTGYILAENCKINNMEKRKTAKEKKYIYVPLTKSLKKIIYKMGHEQLPATDYILAPEINSKRNKVLCDLLSRSFTHFYRKLNSERTLGFKSLRKAYITSLTIHTMHNAKDVTGHTNNKTLDKSYIYKIALARALSRTFEVFSEDYQRRAELEQVRSNSIKQTERTIEK
jgi:hypothetical protein